MEVPRNVRSALQPRGTESFVANKDFMGVTGSTAIVNFYEQAPRPLLQDLVVDKDSAVLDSEYSENIPVARDHEHLVRFEGPDDDAYVTLHQTLQRKVADILDREAESAKEGRSRPS